MALAGTQQQQPLRSSHDALRELKVGAMVELASAAATVEYRIEERLEWGNGLTLYRIKCASEPFDRVVGEADLAVRV